jgi:catechol 2,3-dioxygenase-like lactoylglutathione lyase family enzyme
MELAVPILPADDLRTAKDFYVNGLGFEITFEASEDGHSGLFGVKRGTIQLTIDSPMDGHGRNACVSLLVEDADAYYREWASRVTVPRAPRNEEWGARTFGLLDPSGNTIFVIGPIPKET